MRVSFNSLSSTHLSGQCKQLLKPVKTLSVSSWISRNTWMTSRGATTLWDSDSSVCNNVCLQIGELISEFVLRGHWGLGEWLFLCKLEEKKEWGGEGLEAASREAVMTFQGKLRCRELFGSASVEWWPLFTQVISASSPPHTRHNSFSSQSASEHRLYDCHCPWFITPVLATEAGCHQVSATLESHYKAPVSHLVSADLPVIAR